MKSAVLRRSPAAENILHEGDALVAREPSCHFQLTGKRFQLKGSGWQEPQSNQPMTALNYCIEK